MNALLIVLGIIVNKVLSCVRLNTLQHYRNQSIFYSLNFPIYAQKHHTLFTFSNRSINHFGILKIPEKSVIPVDLWWLYFMRFPNLVFISNVNEKMTIEKFDHGKYQANREIKTNKQKPENLRNEVCDIVNTRFESNWSLVIRLRFFIELTLVWVEIGAFIWVVNRRSSSSNSNSSSSNNSK